MPLALLLAVCLVTGPSHAHNGAATVALPLAGITADGDLSDWPDSVTWHTLEVLGIGQRPVNANDLAARFAVGYDPLESILFVAVEVRDESTVLKRLRHPTFEWTERDRCEIYVGMAHEAGHGEAMQFLTREGGIGGFALPEGNLANPAGVKCGTAHVDGLHRYEWAVATRDLPSGAGDLVPGEVVAFDVSVVDQDDDGAYSWLSWGRGLAKFQGVERCGDVVLGGAGTTVGQVKGKAQNRDAAKGWARRDPVDLQGDGIFLSVTPGPHGDYSVDLPAGHYRARLRGDADSTTTAVVVSPDHSQRLDLIQGSASQRGDRVATRQTRAGPGTRNRLWHTYSMEDGLPFTSVASVSQAGDGGLWLASNVGLVHWDGRVVRSLVADRDVFPSGALLALEDRRGGLWIYRYGAGVMHYADGQLSEYGHLGILPDEYVTDLIEDNSGAIWLASLGGGVTRFDSMGVSHVTSSDGLLNNAVNAMAEDGAGRIWFGSFGGGVSCLEANRFTHYTAPPLQHAIYDIAPAGDGTVWFATERGLVRLRDGVAEAVGDAAVAGAAVSDLHLDRDGVLWLISERGLASLHRGSFRLFDSDTRVPSQALNCLFEDREGNLWVGTRGAGLARMVDRRPVDQEPGSDLQGVRCMIERRDSSVWLGTLAGQVCRSGPDSLHCGMAMESEVTALLEDRRGRLWIGTSRNGVERHSPGERWSLDERDGLVSNHVTSLAEDSEGGIWIGTNAGVCRLTASGLDTYTVGDGLGSNLIGDILVEDSGVVWVASWQGTHSISRFDGDGFTSGAGTAATLHQDGRGVLWGAGGRELRRLDGDQAAAITHKEAPWGGRVAGIASDPEGRIWVAADVGLVAVDGHGYQLALDAASTGTPTDLLRTRTGEFWMSGPAGVARYRPIHSPPPVRLVDVVGGRRLGPVAEAEVPSTEDLLAIEFYGVSFKTRSDRMAYRYRVIGWQDEWTYTRDERVELEDLPLGEFVFEVEAIDRDLTYSDEPVSVRVKVVAPFGLWSLYGALGLALVVVAVSSTRAIRRRRERDAAQQALLVTAEERNRTLEDLNEQLREADRLKSDFVSNVSHELRTPLTVIKGSVDNMLDGIVGSFDRPQLEYLGLLKENSDRLGTLINDLLDLSRIEAGRLHLRPEPVPVRAAVRQALDDLRTLAEDKGIGLRLAVASDEAAAIVDPTRLRQILTNLLTNAVKFTPSGGEVAVTVSSKTDVVQVSVADTGEGIPEPDLERVFEKFHQVRGESSGQRGAGIGLSITRSLVDLHGGRIWAESRERVGSTFHFTLPRAG